MSYYQQNSPLQKALWDSVSMQVDMLVRNNQVPPQVAEQIKRQYSSQLPYSESNLSNTFGAQIPQDAIYKEAQMYIHNSIQRIRNSSMVSQNIENTQPYGNQPFPNQPTQWQQPQGGNQISLMPGRHGQTNQQPNQNPNQSFNPQMYSQQPNTQFNSPMPEAPQYNQMRPDDQEVSNEAPMPKQFTAPQIKDTNKPFVSRNTKTDIQKCVDARIYHIDDNNQYHIFNFINYVPEDSLEEMIHAFGKSNKGIVGLTTWFHDITFPEMIYIDAPLANTKDAIQAVSKVFKAEGWEAAHNTMREHSAKFNDVMGKLLINEINELLSVNAVSAMNGLAPEIISLEDIPSLYSLDPNDPDWNYLLNNDQYQSKVTDVIVKAFTRLFNATKPVLEVPKDIPYIGKCKDVIIRESGFTETTPACMVTDKDGNINTEYIKAFEDRTIVLSSKRVLYTNVVPKEFVQKLAHDDQIIFIDKPTNILEWVLYDRLQHSDFPMDLYLYSVKMDMHFRMVIGKSIEGRLAIGKR